MTLPTEADMLRQMFDALPDPSIGLASGVIVISNKSALLLDLENDADPNGLTHQQVEWRVQMRAAIALARSHDGPLDELQRAVGPEMSVIEIASDSYVIAIRRSSTLASVHDQLSLMKRIIDMTPAAIFAKDLEGRYLFANRTTLDLMRRELDEVRGRRFAEVFTGSPYAAVVDEREEIAMATGEGVLGETTFNIDGEVLHYAVQIFPLFGPSGRVEGTAGIAQNQTENMKIERALREREERFRLAFDHAIGGMALLALDGSFERVNQQLADTLDVETTDLVGARIVDFLHPDDQSRLADFFDGEDDWMTAEVQLRARSGRKVLTETSVAIVRSEGEPIQLVAHVNDITERRALESRARQTEKLQVIEHLTGALAHDINNILGVILGHADMLRDFVSDGEAHEEIEAIVTAAQRAGGYTQRLLNYTQSRPVKPTNFVLDEVAREVGVMLKRSLPPEITLVVETAAPDAFVSGDPTQIQSAVLNLVLNAREAIRGAGTISVTTSSFMRGGASFVEVAVRDTGVGLTPEQQRRVFEPFFSTKSDQRGTGLGLTSVLSTAHAHGGSVRIDSTPGKGSKFAVELPVVEGERANVPNRDVAAGKSRVLVVDDDPALRRMLQRGLARHKYQVDLAEDGQAAVEHLEQHAALIDLILFDLKMPRMDGHKLHLQLQQRWPELPSCLMTGNLADPDAVSILRTGARALQKPFRMDAVLALLRPST